MTKIGFLGPKGTFSHEALNEYTNSSSIYQPVDYASISDIIYAVENGELEEAIVPMENSIEGAINVTMDVIATEVDLKIKGEIVIAVKQNLMVKKGTNPSDIKYILSHPQPLGQCRKFIEANFPGASTKIVYSTAGAAEEVSKGLGDMAAIGSRIAAEVYGLEILQNDVHDGDNNFTRFVILSKNEGQKTGNDKTSIVFSTENKPGSLYRILEIFNLWDINMLRIESRPAKNQLGRYIFFVDIAGHYSDDDVRDALMMVRRKTSFFKLLGSYPACDGK